MPGLPSAVRSLAIFYSRLPPAGQSAYTMWLFIGQRPMDPNREACRSSPRAPESPRKQSTVGAMSARPAPSRSFDQLVEHDERHLVGAVRGVDAAVRPQHRLGVPVVGRDHDLRADRAQDLDDPSKTVVHVLECGRRWPAMSPVWPTMSGLAKLRTTKSDRILGHHLYPGGRPPRRRSSPASGRRCSRPWATAPGTASPPGTALPALR